MRRIFPLCLLLAAPLSHAADRYWDGSLSSSWLDLDNWSTVIAGGTNPATIPIAADRVFFNSDGFTNAITTLGAAQAAQGLVFSNNASAGTTLGTLNDFMLTLGTSGIDVQSGTQTINSSLTVGGNQIWNTATGTSLTQNGTVTLGANLTLNGTGNVAVTGHVTATGNRTITLNNTTGTTTFNTIDIGAGTVTMTTAASTNLQVNGIISGANLTKDGSGTATFNGANSFNGTLRILDGTVRVTASNTAAGQLIFGAASGAAGSNGFGTLSLGTGVNFILGNTFYVHPTSDGAIINADDTTASLRLTGSRTFIVNETAAAQDLQMDAGISASGAAFTLTKQSIGTMVMRGVNTYAGSTLIDRGILALDYSVNNTDSRLSNTTATTLRGGTLELWGNASADSSETIASLSINRAHNTVGFKTNGQNITLNLTGGITRTAGAGVVNFTSNDWSKTTITATGGTVNDSTGILGGWATIDGDRWATKNVSNQIVALAGTIKNDLNQWTAADHIVVDGAITGTLASNQVASLIFDNPVGGTLALNNAASALAVTSGAILISEDVTGPTTIQGGQLLTHLARGGLATELIITNLSNNTLTVAANLGSTNTPLSLQALNLTLAGPGLIVLSGNNNLIGHSAIASNSLTSLISIQGQVRLTGGNALTDYGTVTLAAGSSIPTGALLDINGGSEGVGNLSGGAGGDEAYSEVGRGEVRLGTGGTLTTNQTADTTLSARITGTNATFIKKGNNTLTTTTNVEHTMSGELRVLGGLLDLTSANVGFTSINTVRLRGGQLHVEQNQASTTSVNKLNNSAALILEGTSGNGFRIDSNQNGTRTETVASLALGGSANTITLDNTHAAPTAALTTLAFGGTGTSFTRTNGATLLVRGPNLGGSPGAGIDATRVTFTTPAAINNLLIGTSTTAGAKNLKILPFAIGENIATGVGNTFLTVDSTTGNSLRTLTDSEYEIDYNTAAADTNVSLNASGSTLASKTFNALRINNSAGPVNLTGDTGSTLTLTSGGLLVSAGATDNDTIIGGYSSIQAGTSAVTPDELVVHITSSHAAATGATLTIQSSIIDNGGATSLTKSGAGTLVLSGSNSYTGATTINQGALEFSSASNLGAGTIRVSGGTLRWDAGNTTDITASGRSVELLGSSVYLTPNYGGYILDAGSTFDIGANNITFSGSIGNGGYGGLTKTGTGTLTLSAAPTYTGVTVVNQGAMNFQSIAANTTEALYLIQTANVVSGTLSSTVQNGMNLQSLVVGGVYNSGPNVTANLSVLGGAVNIGDGGGDDFILIGYRDPTATQAISGSTTGSVNFSAASSVNIDVSQIQIGVYNGAISNPNNLTTTGSLILSNGANNITATSIVMGSTPIGVVNTSAASTLALGTGATTINVDSFTIGGQRSRADVTIGSGGSFTLRGQQGGNTGANLFIGDNDATGTGTANTSSLNLTGAANVDILLNQLVLGRLGGSTNNGFGRGTLTYAVGSVTADTIRMAEANYTDPLGTNPTNTQGTITQSGTATMRFRDLSQGTGTATYNWQGGTIGNIANTNLTNQNVTVSLNGGGSATDTSLRTFEVETARTATFEADAEFTGANSFNKTGDGQLALKGTNANTGNVRLNAGIMALVANGSMNDVGWINIDSGAAFDISQRTSAAYTSDAVISGTGTLGGNATTFIVGTNVGTANTNGVLKPGGSSVLNSAANAATVGNQTGTLQVLGSLTLDTSAGRVDRAVLQVGATNRNAASSFTGDIVTWVDTISANHTSFMTGAGTNHDLITITDTLNLNTNGGISIALVGGYTGGFGDVFNLLDWTTITGETTFTIGDRYRNGTETNLDLLLPTLASGYLWDTSLFKSHGVLVVVPEPSRALLLTLALGALFLRRRRK